MQAAEEDFEAGGRKFRAGSFIIPAADRAALDATMKALGIAGFSVAAAPTVATHDLDVPRIGYVHAWSNTQNEGWVRAALDTYGVPYTYFGDIKLREGNLRQKYDVIIFPHVGGNAQSQVNGIPKTGTLPLPYKKTAETPNLGVQDQADDIRGGMGWEGLMELVKFVREGGTLITEGATSTIFPEYNITSGVTVETPDNLFVRGSVMRGVVSDRRSPIAYGYDAQVPVYFSQNPVLSAGGGGFGGFGGGRGGDLPGVGMNTQPMATAGQQRLSTWDPENPASSTMPAAGRGGDAAAVGGRGGRGGGGGRGGFVGGDARRESPARCRLVPDQSRRHAPVGRAGRRSVAGRPRAGGRCSSRSGPRRHVRDPSVLAVADPGHLLPGLQRDPELERPRRRPRRRETPGDRSVTAGTLNRDTQP